MTLNEKSTINDLKPVPVVKYCKVPCEGKTPCVRICPSCPNHLHVYNNGTCSNMTEKVERTVFARNKG